MEESLADGVAVIFDQDNGTNANKNKGQGPKSMNKDALVPAVPAERPAEGGV